MANVKESVTVKCVTKYGIFGLGGVGYYLSPNSGLKPDSFEKGKTYQVLVYTSETGKKYINQIVGECTELPKPVPAPHSPTGIVTEHDVKPGDDKILSKREFTQSVSEELKKTGSVTLNERKEVDWDKKQRQIQWQGVLQANIASPIISMYAASREDWIKIVKEITKEFVDFLQEQSK